MTTLHYIIFSPSLIHLDLTLLLPASYRPSCSDPLFFAAARLALMYFAPTEVATCKFLWSVCALSRLNIGTQYSIVNTTLSKVVIPDMGLRERSL